MYWYIVTNEGGTNFFKFIKKVSKKASWPPPQKISAHAITLQYIVKFVDLVGFGIAHAACYNVWILFVSPNPSTVKERIYMLDQVSLIVCIAGSLLNNTLSLIALICGNDNKHDSSWVFTLLYPLMDQVKSLFQVRKCVT